MLIKKIPPSEWYKIEKTFIEVFDSDMPSPEHATFYGVYEKGQINAFILVENVKFIGQVYSRPSVDNNFNGQAVKKLVDYVMTVTPKGVSCAAVASETRFEGLFRLFRMDEIKGKLFRRDL